MCAIMGNGQERGTGNKAKQKGKASIIRSDLLVAWFQAVLAQHLGWVISVGLIDRRQQVNCYK